MHRMSNGTKDKQKNVQWQKKLEGQDVLQEMMIKGHKVEYCRC